MYTLKFINFNKSCSHGWAGVTSNMLSSLVLFTSTMKFYYQSAIDRDILPLFINIFNNLWFKIIFVWPNVYFALHPSTLDMDYRPLAPYPLAKSAGNWQVEPTKSSVWLVWFWFSIFLLWMVSWTLVLQTARTPRYLCLCSLIDWISVIYFWDSFQMFVLFLCFSPFLSHSTLF